MKKLSSILLIICMVIPSTGLAFADETVDNVTEQVQELINNIEGNDDQTAEFVLEDINTSMTDESDMKDAEDVLSEWEASLGEYTETPANAYTPTT